MKSNFLSVVLLGIAFFAITTSCSNEDDMLMQSELSSSKATEDNMEKFINSVDSLNLCYSTKSPNSQNIHSRGFWSTVGEGTAVTLADAAGGFGGGWVGKILGGSVGSLSGNPLGTIIGYVGGHKAGKYLGAGICSYITSKYFSMKVAPRNIASNLSISNGYKNVEEYT